MNVPILDLKKQAKELEATLMPQINEWFLSGGYIGGNHVKELEEDFQKYLNVKHAITVGNGTDALIISLRACNIGAGDEVITTPFSFFATSEAIVSVGATPVFVDVLGDSFCMDPSKIEEKITKHTKAILPVDIFGHPCDLKEISKIAQKHNLYLIEDSCQAIGAEYEKNKIGNAKYSDLICFSFFPTKNLGCLGDGGLITTDNDDLAIIAKALKEHAGGQIGIQAQMILDGNKNTEEIEEVNPLYNPYKYYNYLIGYNSRLDSVQAIILKEKLKRLPDYNQKRDANASFYIKSLKNVGDIVLPSTSKNVKHCWHQFALRTKYKKELNKYLIDNGVSNAEFYPVPLHLQKALLYLGYKEGDLPVAEQICKETICLPIFPDLTKEELEYVVKNIKDFYEKRN